MSGAKHLTFSQGREERLNRSYLRRIVMEDDILESTDDKIDFLIGEIEVANTKISELMSLMVSIQGLYVRMINHKIWAGEKVKRRKRTGCIRHLIMSYEVLKY